MKFIPLLAAIPDDYKWLARQPYGEWTAFKRKPTIHKEYEGEEEMLITYWAPQEDEFKICEGIKGGNWQESLQRI